MKMYIIMNNLPQSLLVAQFLWHNFIECNEAIDSL